MTYQRPVRSPLAKNPWINGLIDGYRWGTTEASPSIGYTFISSTADEPRGLFAGYPSWGWTDDERVLMLDAIAAIEAVCGLRFVDRGDDNDDDSEARQRWCRFSPGLHTRSTTPPGRRHHQETALNLVRHADATSNQ